MKRSILITGGGGQVGLELQRLRWPDSIKLEAPGRAELDITSAESVAAWFDVHPPQCVVNAAAHTAVDKAEEDVASAFLVNAQGPAFLAEAARRVSAPIIQVSTDYVFDGRGNQPYRESDPTGPLSAYGASKLAGEFAVRAANPRHVIMRTAWVVSAHRSNFIKTMLRLAQSRSDLQVVADQHGSPTSAADFSAALQTVALRLMDDPDAPVGVYHFVNAGEASWHEFAEYIFAWWEQRGSARPQGAAIPSSHYPTPARRPANSRLDTRRIGASFGLKPRPWQEAVDDILSELAASERQEQGKS